MSSHGGFLETAPHGDGVEKEKKQNTWEKEKDGHSWKRDGWINYDRDGDGHAHISICEDVGFKKMHGKD